MHYLTLRNTLAFLAAISLPGCALPGVRAESGCPAGQTCSSEAPNGLDFLGAAFSDQIESGVGTIASGGTETITALTGIDADSPPFAGDFTVTSADPDEIAIGSVTPPSFTLAGDAPGTGLVQLFQPGTTLLLDELDAAVEAISSVTVFPIELDGFEPSVTSFALLAGTSVPLVVRLEGKGAEDRLGDEGTTVASSTSFAQNAWDNVDVTSSTAQTEASFSIQAGGSSFAATVQVVGLVDPSRPCSPRASARR